MLNIKTFECGKTDCMPPHFKQEILTCSQYSIVLLATILVLSNTRQYLFFSSAIAWVKKLININPLDNKWVWEGRCDNLVNCTQPPPSHWKPQWRNVQIFTTKQPEERESWEQKQLNPLLTKGTFREWNDWPQQKRCKTTKAKDNPTNN